MMFRTMFLYRPARKAGRDRIVRRVEGDQFLYRPARKAGLDWLVFCTCKNSFYTDLPVRQVDVLRHQEWLDTVSIQTCP